MPDEQHGESLIPYFTVTFYACKKHGNFNLGFDYNGPALLELDNDELAAECSDAAIRARAIIEDLFASGEDLLDRIAASDQFHEADDTVETPPELRARIAKGGH